SKIREQRGLPERVLVVEDDMDTRRMLVSAIADEGFEPIPALDGQHALRTALAIDRRAIVLDLRLPDLDGAEFARAYRAQKGVDAPTVAVSARSDAEAIAKHIGARAVSRKPTDVGHLIAGLRTTLHPRSASAATA